MQYVTLGRSGLRVSELCLGTMTFGDAWGWGAAEDTTRQIFEAYVEAGGNFIDTANFYTNGSSERLVGACVRPERDRFVIATKYSLTTRPGDPNASGNHRKSMTRALEASFRRLGTDYVDVYWLHAWDFLTPPDEVMRALDDLVRAGKVLYVGVSDSPAWRVAQMNTLADLRGWSSFIGLQVEYSLVERTPARDLLPMARAFGLGVTAWSPLGGGVLSGKYNSAGASGSSGAGDAPAAAGATRLAAGSGRLNERNLGVASAVTRVGAALGRPASQVALSWVRQQPGAVIPLVGVRTLEQLRDNLGCLDFALDPEQLRALGDASAVERGFPHDFLASPGVRDVVYGGTFDRMRPDAWPGADTLR